MNEDTRSAAKLANPDRTPIALTIAGSDSCGGAGIQADIKTFSALDVYGASVITALTAQNTQTVSGIHDVPPQFVIDQIQTVLNDLDICAIKIGMLSNSPVIEAVATVLREFPAIPIVLDPVMVAKSGDKLLSDDALSALRDILCPLATLLTPNIPEAAMLLDLNEAQLIADIEKHARQLSTMTGGSVLLKGGHLESRNSSDVLVHEGAINSFEFTRIDTKNTHGTGCTLSSAIAAGLAKGFNLPDSVANATSYVHQAIVAADQLSIGNGHGPVHHFHAQWLNK